MCYSASMKRWLIGIIAGMLIIVFAVWLVFWRSSSLLTPELAELKEQCLARKEIQARTASAYLAPGTPKARAANTRAVVESLGSVESVEYISADEALALLKERHADEPEVVAAIGELPENPLTPVLQITFTPPSVFETAKMEVETALTAREITIEHWLDPVTDLEFWKKLGTEKPDGVSLSEYRRFVQDTLLKSCVPE